MRYPEAPARPRRGPARTPRRRSLPLARGRRRPAHAGVERGAGRPGRGAARHPSRCARTSPSAWRSWCTPAPSASRSGGVDGPSRRADPARSMPSCASEPDGTVRVLVDPTAVDPAGTTTLDAWSPSWEGDRLAYQLSTGGDEESRLYVLDVTTGKVVDGPVDRCRYSPSPGCPAARNCSTCAASPRPGTGRRGAVPPARLAPPGRCPADTDVLVHGEGSDHLLRRAHQPGRPMAGRLRRGGHRTQRRRLDRRPGGGRRTAGAAGGSGRPDRRLGGPRRPALADVRPRNPALAAGRRGSGGSVPGRPRPGGRRPAASGRRAVRRRTDRRARRHAAGARRPRGRRHRPPLGVGRPGLPTPAGWPTSRAGAGSVSGVSSPPEGGSTAWVGYTDYATPPSVLRWDAGSPPRWRAGSRPTSPARCRS